MPTLDQLSALAEAVPVLNARAARAKQNVSALTLQQQVGDAQAQPSAIRAAQATAPQAVEAQAAPVVQAAGENAKQLTDLGQAGVEQQKADAKDQLSAEEETQRNALATESNKVGLQATRDDIASRKRVTANDQASQKRLQSLGVEQDNALQMATVRQRMQLERLGGDVKDKILDSRLRFERDEIGRKFTDQRQLADYNAATATSEQDFQLKMQQMQEASNRKVQILDQLYKNLTDMAENTHTEANMKLDQESRYKIAGMAARLRERIREEQADAKNRMTIFQQGIGIVGAVAGGVVGGPMGAMAGYGLGQGVGSAIGGATAPSNTVQAEQ